MPYLDRTADLYPHQNLVGSFLTHIASFHQGLIHPVVFILVLLILLNNQQENKRKGKITRVQNVRMFLQSFFCMNVEYLNSVILLE